MRIKLLKLPTRTIDHIVFDKFRVGEEYELATSLACVFLAEGWAEVAVAPPPPAATAKPLVLIVDDEPELRELTEQILTSHGCSVAVAAHGKEALAHLRERCPDLILLDLNMPVMDGWRFRAEQRYLPDRELAAVPVVVMTGDGDPASHAAALFAVGALEKPFDQDDLLDVVSAAMGSWTSQPDGPGSMRSWRWTRKRNRAHIIPPSS